MNLVGLPQSMAVPVPRSGLAALGKDQLVDVQGNSVSNMVPGEGYWYSRKETGCKAWVEVAPYATDLFPAEGSLPAITDIKVQVTSNRNPAVTLAIALDGNSRKIDIYYKDQVSDQDLVLDKGWLMAEIDLPVRGKTTLEWTDAGNSQRKPVGVGFTRYYLVGSADLASTNGIPQARRKFVFGKGSVSPSRQPSVSGLSTYDIASQSLSSTNHASFHMKSSLTRARVIFVDRKNGADRLTGKAAIVVGSEGPKKTVKAGLQEAGNEGNTMIIKSGYYGEDLDISGKNIRVVIDGSVRL